MLREGHKLRVFEKTVLRRIFGPMRKEVTEGWRKLHSGDLHNLYSSTNVIRKIKTKTDEMGKACIIHGGDKKCIQNFGWKV
jgi:hypothetical protein